MTDLGRLVRAACGRGDALVWPALADAIEEAGGVAHWHDAVTGSRCEIPAEAFRLAGVIAAGPRGLTAALGVEATCKRLCRCRSELSGVVRVVPCFESVSRNRGLSVRRQRRRAGLRVIPGAVPTGGGTVTRLDEPVAADVPVVPGYAVLSWTEPVAHSASVRSLELHAHPLDVPALVLGGR